MGVKSLNGVGASSVGTGTERSEFIQALRFVAAALVLMTHSTFYYHERINDGAPVWHPGAVGVSIFFVISGVVMVMSSASLACDVSGAKEFMARRLLRILPLYWLVTLFKVVVALAVPSVVNHNHFEVAYAIKSFLFIPTFNAAGEIQPIHGVGWTLLHEMFFYLVFSAMMLLRVRPAVWASAVILALYGFGLALVPESAFMKVITSPINLNFVIGMLVGSAIVQGGRAWALVAGLAVAAVLQWLLPASMRFVPTNPVVLGLSALMLLLATWRLPRPLRGMIVLGDSSYALYLFHPIIVPPMLMLLHRVAAPLGTLAELTLAVTITIALAHGIYKWVELPLNRWAKRTFRRRLVQPRPVEEGA